MTSHGAFLDDDGDDSPKKPLLKNLLTGGAVAACLLAILCLGYGAFALGLLTPPPSVDAATGCRLDAKIDHTTIVLIDPTDPFTPLHTQRMMERLKTVATSMPDYGKLLVLALNSDDPWNPRTLFERCAPRSPETTSALTGGSEFLRNQMREGFVKPLLASVAEIAKSTDHAKTSPILLSIGGLTQRPDWDGTVPDRRLIYIGDGVEHTPKYSHMLSGDVLAAFKRSPLAKTLSADLQNVKVTIDYLQRSEYGAYQTTAQRRFWRWWFETNGAADVTFAGVRDDSDLVHTTLSDPDSGQRKERR